MCKLLNKLRKQKEEKKVEPLFYPKTRHIDELGMYNPRFDSTREGNKSNGKSREPQKT